MVNTTIKRDRLCSNKFDKPISFHYRTIFDGVTLNPKNQVLQKRVIVEKQLLLKVIREFSEFREFKEFSEFSEFKEFRDSP